MLGLDKIHTFAVKWKNYYQTMKENQIVIDNPELMDQCVQLAIDFDRQPENNKLYYQQIIKHLSKITDFSLLVRVVYLKSMDTSVKVGSEEKEWMIKVLDRIIELTVEDSTVYAGVPQKMTLTSKPFYIYRTNESIDQQKLTINNKGQIWLTEQTNGFICDGQKAKKTNHFKISKKEANRIIQHIASFFSHPNHLVDMRVFEIEPMGYWDIEISNSDQKVYRKFGPFDDEKMRTLSNFLRQTLKMRKLLAFDGVFMTPPLTRITVKYQRIIHRDITDIITLQHTFNEELVIDRKQGSIELIQQYDEVNSVIHQYKLKGVVENFLNKFETMPLFEHIRGDDEKVAKDETDIKKYQIQLDYKKYPSRFIEGSYDKYNLPDDWPYFIHKVEKLLIDNQIEDLFNPKFYNKPKHYKNDYIYCSAVFHEDGDTYYYLTNDDSITVGDYVWVEGASEDSYSKVKIVDIEYFNETEVPYPIERTKKVIRKCSEESQLN